MPDCIEAYLGDCCGPSGPDEWRQLWCETVIYGNQASLPVYFTFGPQQPSGFKPERIFRALTHHVDCNDGAGNSGTADQTITVDPITGAMSDTGVATTGIGFPSSLWIGLGPDFKYFTFSDSGYDYFHANGPAFWHETAIWTDEVHWWERWQPMIDFITSYGLPGAGIMLLAAGERRPFSYDPNRSPIFLPGQFYYNGSPGYQWVHFADRALGDFNALTPPWTTVPYELARLNAFYGGILGSGQPPRIYASVARGRVTINSTNQNCSFSETVHGGNRNPLFTNYACANVPAGTYSFEPGAPASGPDFIDRFSGLQPIGGSSLYPIKPPICCNQGP